jgi:hypothetical protein
MSIAALILAVAAASAPPAEPAHGVELASAEVQVAIVRSAIVRQGTGMEQLPDAPKPQVSRRGGTTLVEFQ